jgi:hypothetical protein
MSMQPMSPRPLVTCPACEGPLKPVGRLPIRRDALDHGVITLAQPGDTTPAIGIDAYRCHDCGRLELYDHDFLLPSA